MIQLQPQVLKLLIAENQNDYARGRSLQYWFYTLPSVFTSASFSREDVRLDGSNMQKSLSDVLMTLITRIPQGPLSARKDREITTNIL